MKLLDRISLQRSITLLLNFILEVIKLLVPKSVEDKNPNDGKKIWRPRWRKDQ